MGFLARRGLRKLAGNRRFPGYKNSWFSPPKHVPFHWPISDPNPRGNTVFPTFNWHLAL